MQMRLAFSVATAVLPDVILLDEALAVGDGRFQKKCVDRIFELKASGRTIFFCSHAMYYVSTLCDRALWLNAGRVAAAGDAQSVVLEYEKFLARQGRAPSPPRAPRRPIRDGRTRRFSTSWWPAPTARREDGVPAGRAVGRRARVRRRRARAAAPDPPRASRRATTSSASRPTRGSTASGRSSGGSVYRVRDRPRLPAAREGGVRRLRVPRATRRRSRSTTRGATARSTSSPTRGGAAS